MTPTTAIPESDPTPVPAIAPRLPPRPRPHRRMRHSLKIVAVLTVLGIGCWFASQPLWHVSLRMALRWEARRRGCELSVGSITGGPFDLTSLDDLYLRERGPAEGEVGTDLTIAHARLALAWRLPGLQHAESSWIRRLALEGVRGRIDLKPRPVTGTRASPSAGPTIAAADTPDGPDAVPVSHRSERGSLTRWLPANFDLQADTLVVQRGRYRVQAVGLALSALRDGPGRIAARELRADGPGFANVFSALQGQTNWKNERLTLSGVDLGDGITVTTATLDFARLRRGRLEWEGALAALGGEVRGQGAIALAGEHLAIELAATLRKTALAPLARMAGIPGTVDGKIDQASFTFRGDPENPAAAQTWLSGGATDFRWDARRWQSLELQSVVVDRRIQIHRLELRQSRNSLSLVGDFPLPPTDRAGEIQAGISWWESAGFSCRVDARLEDLRELSRLVGGSLALDGRMSVNGELTGAAGRPEITGYLNVEGSRLQMQGAPLDFLRATLIFRGGELELADLQATQGADYFHSQGTVPLATGGKYRGDLRAEVKDPAAYLPALQGLPWIGQALGTVKDLRATLHAANDRLTLDQCEGQEDGDPFKVSGEIDLRPADHVMLDLRLEGARRDLPDSHAAFRTGADYSLEVRGPTDGGPMVSGELRLGEGTFEREVEFAADRKPTPGDNLLPLARWIPAAWSDWPLSIRVTAPRPVPVSGGGTVTPRLQISGPGKGTKVEGELDFRSITAHDSSGAVIPVDQVAVAVGTASATASAAAETTPTPSTAAAARMPSPAPSAPLTATVPGYPRLR